MSENMKKSVLHTECFFIALLFLNERPLLGQSVNDRCVDVSNASAPKASRTANDCMDEESTEACTTFFGHPVTNTTAFALVNGDIVRPSGGVYGCLDPDVDPADVKKCAKHCYLCCRLQKFKCEDADPDFGCATKIDRCRAPGFIEIMAQKCAGTCGLCDYNGATTCIDHIAQCKEKEFEDMCNSTNPVLRSNARKACPLTCRQCSTNVIGGSSMHPPAGIPPVENNCADLNGNDCQKNILLCENVYYSRLMSTECRKTCGYCLSPETPCQDKNTADCQRWNNNDFCSNSDYPKGMKLLHCPVTCALCRP